MKITVDIKPLIDTKKSGIGYYTENILREMIQLNRDNEYILNFFAFRNYHSKTDLINGYFDGIDNIKINPCRWFPPRIYQMIWPFFGIPYRLFFNNKNSKNSDVTIFFNFYVPPGVAGKTITVVYDTVYKDYPETMHNLTKTMLKLSLKQSIERADLIITPSEFSRERVMYHYDIRQPEKVRVVPGGVDHRRFKPASKNQILKTLASYNIKHDYFYYIGNLEPRKNLERLIIAYSNAQKKLETFPILVISGSKAWQYESIFDVVENLSLKDKVLFTGYVSEEDVSILMSGGIAFCFPSLYEGFGMPPLEAMACGTPVLVSKTSSIPEVIGNAGYMVNPYSIEEIEQGLIKLASEPSLRTELLKRGLEQSKKFSWQQSAAKFLGMIHELGN